MNYFFLYQTLKAQFSSEAATHTFDECAFGFLSPAFLSGCSIADYGSCSPFNVEESLCNFNGNSAYPFFHSAKAGMPLPGSAASAALTLKNPISAASLKNITAIIADKVKQT